MWIIYKWDKKQIWYDFPLLFIIVDNEFQLNFNSVRESFWCGIILLIAVMTFANLLTHKMRMKDDF